MPIENDFLVFAGQSGANVVPQVSYAGQTWQQTGFSSGIAQSAQLNKPWRQSSIMAAVLAQFIVNNSGNPAIDDGTTATLLANLQIAISAAAAHGTAALTASGNWTCPLGVTTAFASACAAGGGGGSGGSGSAGFGGGGGGGGAGQNIIRQAVTVVPGTVYPIVIGAAGTGGAAVSTGGGLNGTAGGITTGLGLSLSGGGGGAGGAALALNAAGGGGGSGFPSGSFGTDSNSGSGAGGGMGASSPFGGGGGSGRGAAGGAVPGALAGGYGTGGGGGGGTYTSGTGTGGSGGNGAPGFFSIEW
jgi:hypothetical protein